VSCLEEVSHRDPDFAPELSNLLRRNGAEKWQGNYLVYFFKSFPGFFPVVICWFIYFPLAEAMLGYTLGMGIMDLEGVASSERTSGYCFWLGLKYDLNDAKVSQ
jgi:hypothetical protein